MKIGQNEKNFKRRYPIPEQSSVRGRQLNIMKRILNKETIKYPNKRVRVCGWVNSRRDHGKIIFIDLRDMSGLVQVVFKSAQKLRPEWVICVEGKVKARPKGMQNPKMATGKIEIEAQKLEILSEAKTLPFSVIEKGTKETSLEKRMDWRWLDLRQPEKQLIFKVWTVME